ncbi:MAG: KGK domain-containing protein [Microcystaceae cyanobacterium]
MSDQHKFNLNFNDDDVIQFDETCLTRISRLRYIILDVGKRRIINELNKVINILCSENKLQIPTHHRITDEKGQALRNIENNWSDQGVYCEVLSLGSQQWQKGKIRIKFEIEFILDEPEITEPESPLDDIRREINQS